MSFVNYTPTPTRLVTLVEADGAEPLRAATTNVSLEQLADAIAWLDTDLISARILEVAGGDASAVTSTNCTWSGAGTSFADGSPFIYIDIPACLTGDVLQLHFSGNLEVDNSAGADGYDRLRMYAIEDPGGANALQSFNGYAALYAAAAAGTVRFGGVAIEALHVVIVAGTCRIGLQAARDNAGNVVRLKGGWSLVAVRVRH